uniref:deoxyguanosinetriphosphate triphosphohydrolase n=1 Tax=Streptomyces clavuligerus TaxID=1901 RepID=UPI0018D19475
LTLTVTHRSITRTRLTHSLECAQVGRELGAALGCDPDLVEAACLSHDMGHPPFGHNGESVLNEIAKDIGGFEGNAQSLRLLTRIEPKRFVHTPGGDVVSVGLNLTRAALDAATKYPWPRGGRPTDPGSAKFGVYEDDLPVFAWVREGAPEGRTCFEAQVMDWSDDVAYSVHDLEDALHAGHVDPRALLSAAERKAVLEVAISRYTPADTDPEELSAALERLLAQEWWPHEYDGSALAQARLKDATSQLIGRFCLAAEEATRLAHGTGRLTRYGAELVVPAETRLECAVLKAVADRYVMRRADQEAIRAEQRVLLTELADALAARAPEGLEPQFHALFTAADDDRERGRVIVDQLASLTDAAARALHARLTARP